MALANDYTTGEPVRFETESAPEILDTVEIEGEQVALVRYATLVMRAATDAPTFGRSRDVYAIRAGAPVHTLEASFYLYDGKYHQSGQAAGGGADRASVIDRADEFGSSMTVKGAITSARRAIEGRRLYAQYAPIAEANIASHTRDDFEALDPDAAIEPGDLVVVVSHSRYRTGVAIKVGRTRVECLAATPTGRVANGATRTKGKEVRLLRKRIAEQPAAPVCLQTLPPGQQAGYQNGCPVHPTCDGGCPPAGQTSDDRPFGLVAAEVDAVEDDAARLLAEIGAAPAGTIAAVDPAGRVAYLSLVTLDDAAAVRADHGPAGRVYSYTERGPGYAGPTGRERPGEHWNARAIRELAAAREGAGMGIEAPARPVMPGEPVPGEPVPGEPVPGEPVPGEPVPGEPVRCRACGAIMERFDGGWRAVTGSPWPAAEHEHVPVRAAWLERWREQYAGDPVAALLGLVDEVGVERAVETLVTGEGAGDTTAAEAAARARAARAQLAAVLGDPAALRAIADQVEREQLGHVTEIEGPDVAGHFGWRCAMGDGDGSGYDRAEDAYQAAVAHGPLVATSMFARRPVQVHEGGAAGRTRVGALVWEPYDGGAWFLAGYGQTSEIDENDIAGAQAWASGLLGDADYDRPARQVARWQHHQDMHGEWWEPVIRGQDPVT